MFVPERWRKTITAFMITLPILAHFRLHLFCAFLTPRQGLLVCSGWLGLLLSGLV